MSQKDIESVQEDQVLKTYEFAFHIVPKMSQEEALAIFTDVKKQVETSGAQIKNESAPTLLKLEYQMEIVVESVKQKHNQAYFAWVIIEATADQLAELEEEIKLRNDILRYLFISTKNESPISSQEVAKFLNGEEEEEEGEDGKERRETNTESEDAGKTDESDAKAEKAEKSEETESKDDDQKTVDEAIDKLVS